MNNFKTRVLSNVAYIFSIIINFQSRDLVIGIAVDHHLVPALFLASRIGVIVIRFKSIWEQLFDVQQASGFSYLNPLSDPSSISYF
jgi:hypothetical protein